MPSAIAPEKINASGLIGSVHRNLGTANETRVAGIAILDEQLRYVEVNEALAGINGLSVEEHIGKSLSEVIPSMAPYVEPLVRKILQTGVPELNFELKGKVPAFPGETRHWIVSMVPLAGDDGKPHGVGALFMDVSGKSEPSGQFAAQNHLESNDSDEDSGAGKSRSVQLNNKIRILKDVSVALSAAAEVLEHTRSAELYHSLDLEHGIDFNDEVRRFEINLIERALKESAGNQKKAAGLLKLKHTTLHTKIKRYDISTAH